MPTGTDIQLYVTENRTSRLQWDKLSEIGEGLFLGKPGFTERHGCAEDLQSIGFPIAHCEEVLRNENYIIYHVCGAYFPSCPDKKLFREPFLFRSHCSMRCFVSQSVSNMTGFDKDFQRIHEDYASRSENLECFLKNNTVTRKTIKQKFNEAVRVRKKKQLDTFFHLLGHTDAIKSNRNGGRAKFNRRKATQENDVYEKLRRRLRQDIRDTSRCRMVKFHEICAAFLDPSRQNKGWRIQQWLAVLFWRSPGSIP